MSDARIAIADLNVLKARLAAHGSYVLPGEGFVLNLWQCEPGGVYFNGEDAVPRFDRTMAWGDLYAEDSDALIRLARELGIRRPTIESANGAWCIELHNRPLEKAAKMATGTPSVAERSAMEGLPSVARRAKEGG